MLKTQNSTQKQKQIIRKENSWCNYFNSQKSIQYVQTKYRVKDLSIDKKY